jgi:acetyltransferase-like isoleucine patch superfamily enzyme
MRNVFWLTVGNQNLAGNAQIGRGARIHSIRGLTVGKNFKLGSYARVITNQQPSGYGTVEIGSYVKIGDHTQVGADAGQTLRIGDYSSTHSGCYLFGDVRIGRYCLLSANIFISSGEHFYNNTPYQLIKDQDIKARSAGSTALTAIPTTIEDDCWVGWGTVIRRGVTIGKGSIVGANSVVTKDIPPYSVAVGTPAKVIKQRLDFSPPAVVSANRTQDHPYFYNGFELREEQWVQREGQRLLKCPSEGNITFQKGPFRKLQLSIFSQVSTRLEIEVNGQHLAEVGLSQGWNPLNLDCPDPIFSAQALKHPLWQNMTVLTLKPKNTIELASASFS